MTPAVSSSSNVQEWLTRESRTVESETVNPWSDVQEFSSRVAIVTGGASGMGSAIAIAFANLGADVMIGDIDIDGGERVVSEILASGGHARFQRTNVGKSEDVKSLVARSVEEYGGLHFAINCAGIELEDTVLHEVSDDVFDRIVEVNLRGPFLCMKHEIPAMLETDGPACIVNVASVNSFRARPRQIAYTSTKHALIGMTKAAAIEYAEVGVRINAICPGSIDTPMLRSAMQRRGRDPEVAAKTRSAVGRFGRADEVADAAVWLCSENSSYVVGHALVVDGGYLAG